MSERSAAARWAVVADGFSARVAGVPAGRWDDPAPCDGWTARDIVVHLVEWVPALLDAGAGVVIGPLPDPGIVHESVLGLGAMDPDFLASTGQYGPRVQVPADADEQTRLLALLGRRA